MAKKLAEKKNQDKSLAKNRTSLENLFNQENNDGIGRRACRSAGTIIQRSLAVSSCLCHLPVKGERNGPPMTRGPKVKYIIGRLSVTV